MRKRNYINKRRRENKITKALKKAIFSSIMFLLSHRLCATLCLLAFTTVSIVASCVIFKAPAEALVAEESQFSSFLNVPLAATSSKKVVLSVPKGIVKTDPFVPYRDINGKDLVDDVPTAALVPPPDAVNESSDAARVMDTMVSGILYDKFSPSAILNIEGNDYLVKKGDVVNNYKVLDIVKDSVTVCLGANVYTAGIGEILTEGQLNNNEVSNLNNKFGGNE